MIPLRFECMSPAYPDQKIYVTILQKFNHRYTGETIYRIREESSVGWVAEHLYTETYLRLMLKNKVEETE